MLRFMALGVSLMALAYSPIAQSKVEAWNPGVTPVLEDITVAAKSADEQPIQLAAQGRRRNFILGAIIGGVVAHQLTKNSHAAPRRSYSGDGYQAAKNRCARKYRSYNWRSDTFVTYSGVRKLCPYVRPYY